MSLKLVLLALSVLQVLISQGADPGQPVISSPTNHPALSALLGAMGEDVKRDTNGQVVFLALRGWHATDENLALVGQLKTLREIKIYASNQEKAITGQGIAALGNLTNLSGLCLGCFVECPEDVWTGVCHLDLLKRLRLISLNVDRRGHRHLTNLVNMQELQLVSVPGFDDEALRYLTNLAHLRSLWLHHTGVSDRWREIVKGCPSLTNVWFKGISDER